MRIAITADPFIPVPPENYGGIERMIDFLIKGLVERGHELILVAHPQSTAKTRLLPFKEQRPGLTGHLSNMGTIAQLRHFAPDIIHSFSRLTYLLPFFYSSTPKLMSYQREPTLPQIKKAVALAKKNSLSFTGCSNYISNQIKPLASCYTVYNGVDLDKYSFSGKVDDDAPLVFLGRVEPIKGIKTAVNVACATGRKLIIAGNVPPEYQQYFDSEIKPSLNAQINYMGPVNDMEKNQLLGKSAALLMPIDWNEPFGIVMIEAMACGTPVLAFDRGSVPEVVRHGKNGFRCNTEDQMVALVSSINQIDRRGVREDVEKRFSSEVIVEAYLEVYRNLITKRGRQIE